MDKIFDISLYNDEFFEWHLKYAHEYSIKSMDWFINEYRPESVIDFGCGIGSYLLSALHNGITDVKGYDIGGEYAKKYTSPELYEHIEYLDCTYPICRFKQKYECVISFETAEHIEPSGTEQFIKNLVSAVKDITGYLLFTGAPPGQDGCGHINCRERNEWVAIFQNAGMCVDYGMTANILPAWRALGVPNYILDNLIVLRTKASFDHNKRFAQNKL